MATSKYSSKEETTNTSRISRVLLYPCTDQLRDLLRHYVPTQTFPQVIQRHRLKLPKLTKPQMDLILPRSGHYTGHYKDFDISLLYILLRNICNIPPHTKGWGKDPDPNDKSLAANIERIRNARDTTVGHMISSSLSNTDFNNIWSTVRAAVVSIDNVLNNNQQYKKAVDFLKCEVMDPEMAKQYDTRLREQKKRDTETRKMVEDHKAKFEVFKTRAETDTQRYDTEILQIRKRTDEHTAKNDKTETEIQRHDAEILHIRQQTDEQTAKQDKTETEIQRHEAEILHIRQQIGEHTAKQDTTETEIQRHDTEILHIRQQIGEHTAKQDTLETEIQRHEAEILHIRQQIGEQTAKQEKTETEIQRHDAEILHIRQQIGEHTAKQDTLETEIQRHEAEILHIRQQIGEQTAKQEKTETEIQRHDAEILHIRQQIGEHTAKQEKTETEIQRHDAEILHIRQQIGEHTAKQEKTETEIQRHDAEILHIRQQIGEHTAKQEKTETEIQRHDAEILHIRQEIGEHTAKQEKTETEIQRHDAEILHIRQQIGEHTAKQEKTETEIQRHDAEILNIWKQIDDDKSVTASIQEQQTKFEPMVITNRTRQDNMKADIHRHDTEIVNLRQQIEVKQSVTGSHQDRQKKMEKKSGYVPYLPTSLNVDDLEILKKKYPNSKVVVCTDTRDEQPTIIVYSKDVPFNEERKCFSLFYEVIIKQPFHVSSEALRVNQFAKKEYTTKYRNIRKSFTEEEEIVIRFCISENSKTLWRDHSNLQIISADMFRYQKREIVEDVCIVLFCLSKGFIPVNEHPFPTMLHSTKGSMKVDVREGFFQLGPSVGRVDSLNDPLCMGSQIAAETMNQTGSLGVFVDIPNVHSGIGFITCCHVLFDISSFNSSATPAVRNVCQPGKSTLNVKHNINTVCGYADRNNARFSSQGNVDIDAALVHVTARMPTTGHFVIRNTHQLRTAGYTEMNYPYFTQGRNLRSIVNEDRHKKVLKSGNTTGLTTGYFHLNGVEVSNVDEYLTEPASGQRKVMKGQYEIISGETFFDNGDSGSAVFLRYSENDLRCIGIAIGKTSDNRTIVTPIGPIFDSLGLKDDCISQLSVPMEV